MCLLQGWHTGTNGTQLWGMLQNSFAWVTTTGYTNKANATTQFPVVIGEFGSSFANLAVRITGLARMIIAWYGKVTDGPCGEFSYRVWCNTPDVQIREPVRNERVWP